VIGSLFSHTSIFALRASSRPHGKNDLGQLSRQ